MEQKANSFYRERCTLLGLIEALIGVPDVRVDMLHNISAMGKLEAVDKRMNIELSDSVVWSTRFGESPCTCDPADAASSCVRCRRTRYSMYHIRSRVVRFVHIPPSVGDPLVLLARRLGLPPHLLPEPFRAHVTSATPTPAAGDRTRTRDRYAHLRKEAQERRARRELDARRFQVERALLDRVSTVSQESIERGADVDWTDEQLRQLVCEDPLSLQSLVSNTSKS